MSRARPHARGAAVPLARAGRRRRPGRGRATSSRRGRRGARRAREALRARARAGSCCASSPAAGRSPARPETEAAARRLLAKPRTPPLTPAQAETLAIVAYLQPVSRPGDHPHPRRQRRLGGRDAARARADRGGRPLAVRRRPVPHDAAVPQALRPRRARGAARPSRVGPDARGGGRAARPAAARPASSAPPACPRRAPSERSPERRASTSSPERHACRPGARVRFGAMGDVPTRPGAFPRVGGRPAVPDAGAAASRASRAHTTAAAALAARGGALGVVFGDIGTSPLYALQTVFTSTTAP